MRKYENEKLQEVICNRCGREMTVENGILKEGCFVGKQLFDYFSNKDGQIHEFDLCEACYDEWIQSFQVPVALREETELL